jgi:hypothetical protein
MLIAALITILEKALFSDTDMMIADDLEENIKRRYG